MTTRYIIIFLFATSFSLSSCKPEKEAPKPMPDLPRDEAAYQVHFSKLQRSLSTKNIGIKEVQTFLIAYKHEEKLEVWIKKPTERAHQLFKTYDFCRTSGRLGPKRNEGDGQIPEGFYHINVFNPLSNFHLSLGINYPNESDLILSDSLSPGSDIYIHGGCMTIGCIPITDEKIKELYTLVSIAKNNGQQHIPVHIYPFRMEVANMVQHLKTYPQHQEFWESLQKFYGFFQYNKYALNYEILPDGSYRRMR